MDLSVIIPIYNHEQYIKKCLETILEDFPSNSEIIIIDDVCTDKSIEIIESLHSPYIKILHNEKNMGCAYNLNKGIEAAQGKYIGINYSDDFVEKGFYKKMLDIAIEQDADVVCANIADYDEKNETISYNDITVGNLYYGINKEKIQLQEEPFQVPAGFLLGHWTASSASTKIIKKQYYEKYKFSGSKANDIPAIYPIMAAANKIIYYPKLYLFYRKVENSLSRANDQDSYNSVAESIIKTFELLDEINAKEEKEVLFFNNCMDYLFYVLSSIPDTNQKIQSITYFVETLQKNDFTIFENMKKSKLYAEYIKKNKIEEKVYDLLNEKKVIDFIIELEKKRIIENKELCFQAERNELQNEKNEQAKELALLKTQLKTNEEEICNLQKQLKTNEEENCSLQKQLKINQEENCSLQKQIKINEEKICQLQKQYEEQKQELTLEKKRIIEKDKHIENIFSEKTMIIAKYENSKSWKITRPMREIAKLIRHNKENK